MKRIDLFMPPLSQYGVLHHFTKKLHEAFENCGVNSHLLEAKKKEPLPFLEALFKDPAECTLSFNGLLPDDEGHFFSDMIRIPHVACLVDSPNNYLPLTRSPYSIVTCPDRDAVDFFRGIGFSRVLFMPHAVEGSIVSDPYAKREYDVVSLSSCIDFEGIRAGWSEKYSQPLCQAMEEAAEITLSDQTTPYYKAFVEALGHQVGRQSGIDPDKIDFVGVLDELEMYIRGKDRFMLLDAIDDAKVDLFGSKADGAGWKKYFGDKRNIVIHDPVPFEQALSIMKHSKIVLNSCPWIKNGAHERIFTAMACGALVITNENVYMKEQFEDGKSVVFYSHKKWDKVNTRVNQYLENQEKRQMVAENGRNLVMKNHTWDNRAKQLCQELPPLLEEIRESTKELGGVRAKDG